MDARHRYRAESSTRGSEKRCQQAERYGLAPDEVAAAAAQIEAEHSSFLRSFKALSEFQEQPAEWLIPGWIPRGQITLLAADGGVGKTTLWCNIAAAVSSGRASILDPPDIHREPGLVAFLTTEDSVRKKLKRKLRIAGADEQRVITPDFQDDAHGALRRLKFGSHEMAEFIRYFRPALCIFDPLQGFVPPDVNMASRNGMRDCMAPLVTLGEETETSFIVVCHSNKRKGASGRDRIADSADLWDIARSVLMAGYADREGVRYLSQEKSNYAELRRTLLFSIDGDGQPQAVGETWKRDREFQAEAAVARSGPKREDCREFLVDALKSADGQLLVKDLECRATAAGYSFATIRRAKEALKKDGLLAFSRGAGGAHSPWFARLADSPTQDFWELPTDTETPWG